MACYYCDEKTLIYCSLCKRELKKDHTAYAHRFKRFYCKGCIWRKSLFHIRIKKVMTKPKAAIIHIYKSMQAYMNRL